MIPLFAWDGVLGLLQALDSPGSAYGPIRGDRRIFPKSYVKGRYKSLLPFD
jgi:hypothetical protein